MFGRSKIYRSAKDKQLLEQFDYENYPNDNGWVRAFFSFVVETIKILILATAIILPIRYFLIQPFYVKGASMEPNFYDREYLMINEISYRFSDPERSDITVFRYPRDPSQFFIKRVIGVPGDTIEIKDGKVYLYSQGIESETILDESGYLSATVNTTPGDATGRFTLDDDEYFLLGDNRGQSLDSRNFGPVKRSLIIGKVWFRGWPLDKVEVFN